ncbi:MAG: (d)CMP kinase [Candidatus Omnitrophica bacterium]|nr:(d)CMP kinase [Candidatus Omnitrophota bacterium]MBL7151479.1 (d)CMP kinase [Candidatus Omnitrophota bacterium]MBL7210248.1 (d)CMP kinase [Candidatus Omnitrophota bacterium]
MIIAIDGPAGAGKSSVAKIIAKKLGLLYIDTGAMYRALTLKALEDKIDINDTARLIEISRRTQISLRNSPDGSLEVFLDGRDVSAKIRQPQITRFVSDVARVKEVREVMLGLQRELGQNGNAVLDGRDIGTVVFPGADKKFYIDADFKERVKRRHKELLATDSKITAVEVEADLSNRDKIDSTREFAPLKKAQDALYIDTTDMTIEEVVQRILLHIKNPK